MEASIRAFLAKVLKGWPYLKFHYYAHYKNRTVNKWPQKNLVVAKLRSTIYLWKYRDILLNCLFVIPKLYRCRAGLHASISWFHLNSFEMAIWDLWLTIYAAITNILFHLILFKYLFPSGWSSHVDRKSVV